MIFLFSLELFMHLNNFVSTNSIRKYCSWVSNSFLSHHWQEGKSHWLQQKTDLDKPKYFLRLCQSKNWKIMWYLQNGESQWPKKIVQAAKSNLHLMLTLLSSDNTFTLSLHSSAVQAPVSSPSSPSSELWAGLIPRSAFHRWAQSTELWAVQGTRDSSSSGSGQLWLRSSHSVLE